MIDVSNAFIAAFEGRGEFQDIGNKRRILVDGTYMERVGILRR